MRIMSKKEFIDIVRYEGDLYSPECQSYAFRYSERGAICIYFNISEAKALELQKMSEEYNEYWGAFLGWGGAIYDDPLYELPEWTKADRKIEWYFVGPKCDYPL